MDFENAKSAFISLLDSLGPDDRYKFVDWVQRECASDTCATREYVDLKMIAEDIKSMVPLNAIFPSEKIFTFLPQTDGEKTPTLHVDSFLYEEDDIDSEMEEHNLCRNYCADCHSVNISSITYISHSTSIERIMIIFKHILTNLDGKTFLDIGSRLGAVLYGAYHCSAAKRIIGVEINQDMCKLQWAIIEKYQMQDRIEVIQNDICNLSDVIAASDAILLNNVFECFMNEEQQVKTWLWLKKKIKRGTVLVTVPSMDETLSKLQTGIDVSKWLEPNPIVDPVAQMKLEDQDLLSELCSYTVL